MAVQNSLAKRQTKTGMAAYLTQDAVKKQINSVVGGRMVQDSFPVLYRQFRQHRLCRNVRIQVFCQQHYWERR